MEELIFAVSNAVIPLINARQEGLDIDAHLFGKLLQCVCPIAIAIGNRITFVARHGIVLVIEGSAGTASISTTI